MMKIDEVLKILSDRDVYKNNIFSLHQLLDILKEYPELKEKVFEFYFQQDVFERLTVNFCDRLYDIMKSYPEYAEQFLMKFVSSTPEFFAREMSNLSVMADITQNYNVKKFPTFQEKLRERLSTSHELERLVLTIKPKKHGNNDLQQLRRLIDFVPEKTTEIGLLILKHTNVLKTILQDYDHADNLANWQLGQLAQMFPEIKAFKNVKIKSDYHGWINQAAIDDVIKELQKETTKQVTQLVTAASTLGEMWRDEKSTIYHELSCRIFKNIAFFTTDSACLAEETRLNLVDQAFNKKK